MYFDVRTLMFDRIIGEKRKRNTKESEREDNHVTFSILIK